MERRRINLALQGGGAHGAFTWGVLDRLLEEEWLDIAAITGTSAGALNGAALHAGLAAAQGRNGRRAARENLRHIWSEVGQVSDSRVVRWLHSMFPVPRSFERLTELFSPVAWLDNMTRLFSPYDYGPFYSNPLRAILRTMPYPEFGAHCETRIFVNATNVRTGQARVFMDREVTVDAVLASACLPTIYRAIKINDPVTGQLEEYWDGGYSGNPSLWPLYHPDLPRDIVVVNINPMRREDVPHSPGEIADRVNEISFNSALLSELRAINFVKRLHDEKRLEGKVMKNVLLHMIMDDTLMNDLSARSKMLPNPGMLERMFNAGRGSADRFIEQHADDLNQRDSVDMSALFPRRVSLG
ncbi:patatin-like phospholipase family protein [Paracoccus aerodenitrificans]|uniref:patatin-like phospholipase family protein n=1 Tax=Paracoccus aerodenitrificans TaxID=3017781 RepID=UPI0022F021AA|nr:patatin-like phospholipase family protein [Paracoccus aerodenitrificans]WBU65522.1 patatin-like phospholipase family protein [Paracoccus aerodenitrificans]